MALPLLYDDPWLLAVDKPSGIAVHRGESWDRVTLVTLLRDQLDQPVVHPAHRLDRGTSGVILFAKDSDTARALQRAFSERQVRKHYLAVVRGVAPEHAEVDRPVPVAKDNPRRLSARSRMRRLEVIDCAPRAISLVEAEPLTGRRHQLRRHLRHLNHPILGDSTHGDTKVNRLFRESLGLPRLALHAASLGLLHPHTGVSLRVRSPLPGRSQRLP